MKDGPGISDMIRNLKSLNMNIPSSTWSLAEILTQGAKTFACNCTRLFVCLCTGYTLLFRWWNSASEWRDSSGTHTPTGHPDLQGTLVSSKPNREPHKNNSGLFSCICSDKHKIPYVLDPSRSGRCCSSDVRLRFAKRTIGSDHSI